MTFIIEQQPNGCGFDEHSRHMQQLIRYTLVGLVSNGVAYILYLSLTYYGIGHKTTMTLLYVMGVAQTFYFNRGWTFEHNGKISSALIRYIIVYALGYVFNFALLVVFVDHFGWIHQWVQGGAISLMAIFLFFAQKFWVFPRVTQRH